mgnify:CR=1 FL=1
MLENIRISIQGIWSHKMRSFLTMLGIIIGIASIIAIVSTLKGTNEQIKEDLIGAGNNTVSITLNYGDSAYDQEYGMGDGTAAPLLSDEQKEEVRKLDHIEDATFFYSRSYASNVYYQNTSFQANASVPFIRCYIITISGRKNLFLIADGEFEFTAHHVSGLAVIMLVHGSYRTFIKFHFDHHQLSVIRHNLTIDTRSRIFPLQIFLKLKSFTTCFHTFVY